MWLALEGAPPATPEDTDRMPCETCWNSTAKALVVWIRTPLPLGTKMIDILTRRVKKGLSEGVTLELDQRQRGRHVHRQPREASPR